MPSPSTKPPLPSWLEWLAVLATSLVITILMTWPMVPHLGSFSRLDSGDGRFSIWNVGWVDHALLTDPRHLLDANIFWPHTGTLAYSEMNLVAGLLGAPVFAVTRSALAAHNAAVLLALFLCLILTWRLVRTLTGSSGAGYVSAVLFTFCSFTWGHTAHIQLLMTFVLPLVLLAFHRLHSQPTVGRAAMLGAALAVATMACGYYGVYGGVFLAFVALAFGRRDRAYWLALGGAGAVAALMLLPVVVPYLHARAATGVEPIRNDASMQISATLQDYLTAPTVVENAVVRVGWAGASHESLSPGFVLGLLLVIAVIWAMRQTRASRPPSGGVTRAEALSDTRLVWGYSAATALAVWASLGPRFGLYALLMRVVPGIHFLRAPCRLGIAVALGLAVIGGFGARRLLAGRSWRVLALLVAVCVVDRFAVWPGLEAEPIPRVYHVLATLPPGAVVDFPFQYVQNDYHQHTRAMYYSTVDWKPRVNGYSDIVPQDFVDIALPINAFPELPAFQIMRRYQVRYVVWEMAGYTRDPVTFARLSGRFAAAAPYLRSLVHDQDFWLYEIVGWPPAAALGAPGR